MLNNDITKLHESIYDKLQVHRG